MKRLFLISLLVGGLVISISAQEPKATEDSMKATKTASITPIKISDELQVTLLVANKDLALANKELEIARLKKDNTIYQLRLLLKVPNDYNYNESTLSFDPPKETPKEDSKKEDKKKK